MKNSIPFIIIEHKIANVKYKSVDYIQKYIENCYIMKKMGYSFTINNSGENIVIDFKDKQVIISNYKD